MSINERSKKLGLDIIDVELSNDATKKWQDIDEQVYYVVRLPNGMLMGPLPHHLSAPAVAAREIRLGEYYVLALDSHEAARQMVEWAASTTVYLGLDGPAADQCAQGEFPFQICTLRLRTQRSSLVAIA